MSLRKFVLPVSILCLLFVAIHKLSLPVFAAVSSESQGDLVLDVQSAEDLGTNLEALNKRIDETAVVRMAVKLYGRFPDDYRTRNTSFVPGGVVGIVNGYITQAFVPPASGMQYLAQLKDNMLGRPALAQGQGFTGLQPLLAIWKALRNIVFSLSSLVFIALAIMIMFRVKINPQTVISIQSAIPQVISTLILVAFSYAIAGLLIDLSVLIQGFAIAALFTATGTGLTTSLLKETVLQIGPAQTFTFSHLMEGGLWRTFDLSLKLIAGSTWSVVNNISTLALAPLRTQGGLMGVAATINDLKFKADMLLPQLIIVIVFGLVILFFLLKLLFGLIKTYTNVIFNIVTAPLQIGLGAIPGLKGAGFGPWITNLFAHLMVFPIVLIFLIMAAFIVEGSQTALWSPAILDPGGIISAGGLAFVFIGFGALMLVSQLPDLVPQLIFNLKPSGWETAIGKASLPGGAFARGAIGNAVIESADPAKTGYINRGLNKVATALGGTPAAKAVAGGLRNATIGAAKQFGKP